VAQLAVLEVWEKFGVRLEAEVIILQ
jgi:UDP-N-acetylenolpyruvoylglucosamine reductase